MNDKILEAEIVDEENSPDIAIATPIKTKPTIKDPKIFVDNSQIVQLRLRIGADPNILNKKGRTPLMNALFERFKNCTAIVRHLVNDERTDINIKNKKHYNYTALIYASSGYGSEEIVKMILSKRNIEVNAVTSSNRYTALHCACALGFPDIVKVLLEVKNIEVNVFDKEGLVPLHRAILRNKVETVKVLLDDSRVDPYIMSKDNRSVLDMTESEEILKLLAGN